MWLNERPSGAFLQEGRDASDPENPRFHVAEIQSIAEQALGKLWTTGRQ